MSKVIVNNLATEYRDEGDGPIILMLHGWGGSFVSFDKITDLLKLKYRIVRMDLPGFGNADMPKNWNLDSYVDFVRGFCEKLGITPYVILGHSFGGRIILKGSAKRIFNPRKIILISAAGVSLVRFRRKVLTTVAKIGNLLSFVPPLVFWRHKIRGKFYKLIGSDYGDQGHLKRVFASVVGEDLTPYAREINTPTLLIWGENDLATPLADGKFLHSLIKDSQMKIVRDASHFSFLEKPEEVVKLIEEFV